MMPGFSLNWRRTSTTTDPAARPTAQTPSGCGSAPIPVPDLYVHYTNMNADGQKVDYFLPDGTVQGRVRIARYPASAPWR